MTCDNTRYTHHPAPRRLRRAAWRERDLLVQALGIEYDWRYHDGPEWAGRYWAAFGDLERLRASTVDSRQLQAINAHRQQPACASEQVQTMRALFRYLLACLHPVVVPAAAQDVRASQWQQVRAAYTAGDYAALAALAGRVDNHAYANGLRLPLAALRREYRRLRGARMDVDHRLMAMSSRFPWCLRDKLDDARWVARQRRSWHQLMAVAVPERLSNNPASAAL